MTNIHEKHWQQFVHVISETFFVSCQDINSESVASDIDGWDSISHTYLILELENSFNIELPVEETHCFDNIGELFNKVIELIGGNGG